ncbi:MAG TPA: RiPP maturation radical SAM C-methyltransferase [Candidatus Angelobacter sp.]
MFRISLVNMPFANLELPSIALTQLKSILESTFGNQVSVQVLYLNQDFAKYLGTELYIYLSDSMESLNTGLGDWFFRQAAFPEQRENTEDYFNRYFPRHNQEVQRLKEQIAQKRRGVDQIMQEVISKYGLDQAGLVGFTSMFMQNTASFAMAKKLKSRNAGVITMMGGANCEFPMGGVIAQQIREIDYVFSGPALKSLPEFVGHCLEGDRAKASSIPGIFAQGMPLPQPGPRTLGEELSIDTPIELDYASFVKKMQEDFVSQGIKPVLTLETSRGCWWGERAHCTFCGLNGATMGYRSMKPDLAIQLFNSLFQYSGTVKQLKAVDNILPKSYLTEVLPFLNTPPDMDIFYEVKADLSEQDVATLARARVKSIQPGIEALATTTLKLMKKGTTAFQNLKLLKSCALYGVAPQWNLLVGFPGETADVFRKYVDLIPRITHLYPPSGAFPVRFDRFSPYYDQADKYQLNLRPLDFYSLIYPFGTEDITNLAYYFMDKNTETAEPQYFMALIEWLGELGAKVGQWRALWKVPENHPKLCWLDNGVVYDSRSGAAVEHHVGTGGRTILQHLEKPTRIADLVKVFSPELDVADEIARLQAKGLLFQEDDRLFSLVIETDDERRGRTAASEPSQIKADMIHA